MTTAGQLRRAGVYVPPNIPDHEEADAIHFTRSGVVRPAMEELAQRTAELVREELAHNPPPPRETYTLADLRVVLACESDSAVYRTLEKLRLRAYAPGKYRVREVNNAMAKASLRERMAAGYVDEKGREAA